VLARVLEPEVFLILALLLDPHGCGGNASSNLNSPNLNSPNLNSPNLN